MDFVIEGLDPEQFEAAFADPAAHRAITVDADDDDYPCRVSLAHAPRGDSLLLINFEHQPAPSPYRSSHAIYVARSSSAKGVFRNQIPPAMRCRTLSVRAFDKTGMMTDAKIIDGENAASLLVDMLGNADVDYVHIHFATRGCYAGRAHRVG